MRKPCKDYPFFSPKANNVSKHGRELYLSCSSVTFYQVCAMPGLESCRNGKFGCRHEDRQKLPIVCFGCTGRDTWKCGNIYLRPHIMICWDARYIAAWMNGIYIFTTHLETGGRRTGAPVTDTFVVCHVHIQYIRPFKKNVVHSALQHTGRMS